MADVLPPCPACAGEHTYEMSTLYVCPLCGFEWSASAPSNDATLPAGPVVKDAVGNVLADGDTVVVTTSIKVKGSPHGIKAGTKVRNIHLIDPVNGHDIDCKVDGFGAMLLKSSLVKRA
ncbi:zinc ribbon domain-containing protein YjdM [Microbacterium sp. MYb32]|uniref:zinc ribbon domain-containing protein YjdM n=1 Tax=unclassified Microbacterium TaxID=2609290 RepID=UPI000CFD7B12|nr:zinc ribbon domain-containing protein YjdM [Microbacterium sp. MYb32]PQZ53525.1 phosphonoacetate hydrolase [Microbacterium sp. MYb43]PQZ75127.1 phosphonoacetate hydrolase [Microbacterium sp. MYb40]PRB19422.1 phosphonoacetate hydrolase [Microbacterium sp. MYb54]PRB24623.1 phosphonoacetate hydrolase [Microbacterium sp. MYb50]PRB63734.1 phosphonoacetate hydrolase [Microbacterium sp. MYb24]